MVTTTTWDLEPHTKAKHDLLVRYLQAWFPVLSRYTRRVVFLDGFAGPGVYASGEPGSPRIALEALLKHSYLVNMDHCEFLFIFNEHHPQRYASLEAVVADVEEQLELPANVVVTTSQNNFSVLAKDMLQSLGGKNLAPTFAFLDPFGYRDVPMALIRDLLAFEKCELFIYFDFNSVVRFSTAGNVDSHFENLFGTDEFKYAPPAGDPRRGEFLHDLYEKQLKEFCGFPFVQSFQMVNKKGKTGNYLFFCTRSVKGLSVMKEAMWKVDPSGGYTFSDLLHGQTVLFEPEVDTRPLQHELATMFRGRCLSIEEIEEYVVVHTPYCKSHVKRKTLAEMQRKNQVTSPNQKTRNTYPPGTLVQFL
ncbi:three-Cys-motif partner protein TcmP [Arthrobacter sp. AK04]|uniref:three-Cys-motif partner protein TcmP n=1 Tax=Arthrobacter sp. AK04 TaxID=2900048 RepID=UPI001E58CD94|nr:three-Cys-motif partner protein TcmP [Arthrobacter sp. AK04]MCD5341722.1 three-Cys-motif partner protein TcmP [Arthrobacter sp. AK04]